uniref:F-box domain-containing protein n=1 Tax=Mycena chlorophos TaxID=658473 RepID=A0ABQ0M5H1_MYCCL|nr:predicted protein [Mycena chlorophos]
MIFTHCAPDNGLGLHYLSVNVAPRLLAQVCRKWRHVVLSTPTLWAKIHVNLHLPPAEGELVRYLERAGGVPLNVVVRGRVYAHVDDEGDEDPNAPPRPLPKALSEHVRLLARYCGRIRRLRLDVSEEIAAAMDVELCRSEFTTLETLELSGMAVDALEKPLQMFAASPRLTRAIGFSIAAATVTLPWEQLEHYSGSVGTSPVSCNRLLESMPNLRRLGLYCMRPELESGDEVEHDLEVPSQRFIHPNIETLTTDAAAGVLNFLTFPALHTMEFIRWDPSTIGDLANFLRRSTMLSNLQIHMSRDDATVADFLIIFKSTPALQVLELQGPDEESFGSFCSAVSHSVLPCLNTLSATCLRNTSTWFFTDMMGSFVSALRKRQTLGLQPAQMRSLVMDVRCMRGYFFHRQSALQVKAECMRLPDEDFTFLRQLKQQGVAIDIWLEKWGKWTPLGL